MISLDKYSIGILGLGQMGGSLASALKAHNPEAHIIGFDIHKSLCRIARRRGIISNVSHNDSELIKCSQIVILALPISTIIEIIKNNHHSLLEKSLVIDVGSIRTPIQKAISKFRLDNYVGIHPICGTALPAPKSWNDKLFEGVPCFIFSEQKTKPGALTLARRLVKSIGGKNEMIDFREHDAEFALTSGIPHVMAYSLMRLYQDSDIRHRSLCGPSFRSATRVASTDPEIASQFLFHNRKNITRRISDLQGHLRRLKMVLSAGDFNAMKEYLEEYGRDA